MLYSYDNYTDEQLIEILRDGDESVTDYLMNKYKELVKIKARSMFILGGDNDDLIQEGMIGLFKAVRDYDTGRDASFHTFAELCISRQMYTAIEAAQRKKHSPLNGYVSIDDEESSDTYMYELMSAFSDSNPEEILIDEENVRRLEQKIDKALSTFEKQVLDLRITGLGYVEIAKILGKDEKSADNALGRIKTKVKKIIEEDKDNDDE